MRGTVWEREKSSGINFGHVHFEEPVDHSNLVLSRQLNISV